MSSEFFFFQVAISTESTKLLETSCFDQTLNLVWFDKLSLTNQQLTAKLAQIPCIGTAGLLAPAMLNYRNDEKDSPKVCREIHFIISSMNFVISG